MGLFYRYHHPTFYCITTSLRYIINFALSFKIPIWTNVSIDKLVFVKSLSQKKIKILKSYSNYIIVNVFRKLCKLMCRIIYKKETIHKLIIFFF